MKGLVFDIQNYAIYDGPGIRSVVYLKGCPLRCYWCHNPESQSSEPEWMTRPGGRELVGREMSVEAVMESVLPDRPFFDHSGGGVTLSGGEPLFQHAFALALLRRFRDQGIHTAVETCGLFPSAILDELAQATDLFLFDLKHMDSAEHKKGTRVANGQILRNFAALLERVGASRVTVRMPLIPGFNTTRENLGATLQFLADHGYEGELHLMPYHGWARGKYESLGRGDEFREVEPVPDDLLASFERRVESHGLTAVCYGG